MKFTKNSTSNSSTRKTTSQQTYTNKSSYSFQQLFLSKRAFRTATISSFSALALSLSACQSTTGTAQIKNDLIQPQLLNLADNPSASEEAKKRLVNAIKPHIASEQFSTSVARYSIRPFVAEDSVDADSQSIFQTVLETYFYEKATQEGENELEELEGIEEYIEEVEAEIAEAKANGDDSYEDYTDEDIQEEAEYRYLLKTYEKEEESEKSDKKINNFFSNYTKMKREQVEKELNPKKKQLENDDMAYINAISSGRADKMVFKQFLNVLHRTPKQIEAIQAHNLDYFSMQMIGHHRPDQMSYQGVLSYDFASPTQTLSAQLPYGIDFKKASATVDPSVVVPLAAIFVPDKLDLPKDMESHTVTFTLPEKIRDKVPTEAIYTAFIDSIGVAFSEMDSEYFTPVAISEDEYAREVGAKRAVKVYLGSKEMGEFIGKMLKSMSQDLQVYVSEHPELYEDELGAENLLELLTAWSSIERDFQSKDVGGLLQIVEAVAPINFQKSMYYYLGSDNTLKGYQAKTSIGSELYGWTLDAVLQTRYDSSSVQASPLYQLYVEDFGKNAPESINGNKWFAGKSDSALFRKARYARYDYPEWESLEPDYEGAEAAIDEAFIEAEKAVDVDFYSDDDLTELEKVQHDFDRLESNTGIDYTVGAVNAAKEAETELSDDELIEMLLDESEPSEPRPRNKQEMRDKWGK